MRMARSSGGGRAADESRWRRLESAQAAMVRIILPGWDGIEEPNVIWRHLV